MLRNYLPLAGLALCAPFSALGHHSVARYFDVATSITVEGTVTEFVFENPHSFVHMAVADPAGGTDQWLFEWDDASDLAEDEGYTAQTIQPGDRLVISGNPARDGSNQVHIRALRRPADGLEYQDRPRRRR